MATDILIGAITLVAGLTAGAIGFAAGWLLSSRRRLLHAPPQAPVDSRLDRDIEGASRDWAAERGYPELAGLVANKLRLAWRIRGGRDQFGGKS